MINLANLFENLHVVSNWFITPVFVVLTLWRLSALEKSLKELRQDFMKFLLNK